MMSLQPGDEDILILNVDRSVLTNAGNQCYGRLICKYGGSFELGFFGCVRSPIL